MGKGKANRGGRQTASWKAVTYPALFLDYNLGKKIRRATSHPHIVTTGEKWCGDSGPRPWPPRSSTILWSHFFAEHALLSADQLPGGNILTSGPTWANGSGGTSHCIWPCSPPSKIMSLWFSGFASSCFLREVGACSLSSPSLAFGLLPLPLLLLQGGMKSAQEETFPCPVSCAQGSLGRAWLAPLPTFLSDSLVPVTLGPPHLWVWWAVAKPHRSCPVLLVPSFSVAFTVNTESFLQTSSVLQVRVVSVFCFPDMGSPFGHMTTLGRCHLWTRKRGLTEGDPAGASILDFPDPRILRKMFLLGISPGLWFSVMAIWMARIHGRPVPNRP